MRTSIPPSPDDGFHAELRAWELGTTGIDPKLFKYPKFKSWSDCTIARVESDLRRAYSLGVPPSELLHILTMHKLLGDRISPSTRKKFGNLGAREKDARALESAAQLLTEWKPVLTERYRYLSGDVYPNEIAEQVRTIAQTLREIGPSQIHRPREVEVQSCLQSLASEFWMKTGNQWPTLVGRIFRAAFPDQWNPAGDIKDATRSALNSWGPAIHEIDSMTDPVWLTDKEGTLIHLNHAAAQSLKIKPPEVVGQSVQRLTEAGLKNLNVRYQDRRAFGAQKGEYWKFLTRGNDQVFEMEVNGQGKDGKRFRIHAQRVPLVGAFRGAKTYIEGEPFSKAFD